MHPSSPEPSSTSQQSEWGSWDLNWHDFDRIVDTDMGNAANLFAPVETIDEFGIGELELENPVFEEEMEVMEAAAPEELLHHEGNAANTEIGADNRYASRPESPLIMPNVAYGGVVEGDGDEDPEDFWFSGIDNNITGDSQIMGHRVDHHETFTTNQSSSSWPVVDLPNWNNAMVQQDNYRIQLDFPIFENQNPNDPAGGAASQPVNIFNEGAQEMNQNSHGFPENNPHVSVPPVSVGPLISKRGANLLEFECFDEGNGFYGPPTMGIENPGLAPDVTLGAQFQSFAVEPPPAAVVPGPVRAEAEFSPMSE